MAEPRGLKTLIVDDEPLAVERLQILCAQIPGINLVGTATNGAAAMRLIEALAPDLLLLDIQMPGMDGMAVARALSAHASAPAVIFVTAFDEFAVAAFDVAASDYLLKPVAPERLERAVARVRAVAPRTDVQSKDSAATDWIQEFWVHHRAEIIRVPAGNIDIVTAERDYMRLHVGQKSYLLHETIAELERRLDPEKFIRIHRSTIVRRDLISGFRHDGAGGWEAQMRDGQWLRVGRTYVANARALAGQKA